MKTLVGSRLHFCKLCGAEVGDELVGTNELQLVSDTTRAAR